MEIVEQILLQKKVQITAMRQLILEHFLAEKRAIGLNELEEIFPKSDRITIYRTLKTYEKTGILHAIEGAAAEVKYALCHNDCSATEHLDNHAHFHCLDCHSIACLETIFVLNISLPKNYQLKKTAVMLKGICMNCQ